MWVNMSYFSAWEALTEKGEINPSGPLGGAQLMQAAGIDPALWQTNGELDYAKIEKNFGKGGKMISVTLQGAPGDKNAAKRWQQYDRFTPISPTARLHPARITPVASSYTPGQDAGGVVGDDDIPF
jgi:hypothetical protein